jgi:hypothetical protein
MRLQTWQLATTARLVVTLAAAFLPQKDSSTYVSISEASFTGNEDELAKQVTDSTQGFSFVLAGLKALLEHDVSLNLVADRHPNGIILWHTYARGLITKATRWSSVASRFVASKVSRPPLSGKFLIIELLCLPLVSIRPARTCGTTRPAEHI